MIHPEYAGIYLEVDITGNDLSVDRFEYVSGLADGLASGIQKPLASVNCKTIRPPILYREFLSYIKNRLNMFEHPLDLEWAYSRNSFYMLQARPISKRALRNLWMEKSGIGAGTGIVTGTIQRWPSYDERPFINGNILVTTMTEPSMVRQMLAAKGIVTEIGGRTCHAAIVARELGKPCVVGLIEARALMDGDVVTIDATAGTVKRHEQNNVKEVTYAVAQ
jgi:phosphoenolpyruvate synthase/pyruvate phosphate dikinase